MSEIYTIYGKVDCPQCEIAKRLLERSGCSYTYLQLDKDYTKEDLLGIDRSIRYLPVVVWSEHFIGGLVQLRNHLGEKYIAS